ncbi:hypothetical protein E0Z10_g1275 [Xylaria hypoxylon]|uniref:Uncharacterized protein n=1 Tax=Xylaria hypoxylon TaxID=37992 RepID=A0A4Z0Z730_9PEZI|nr:hypothetical protein E0Z10_g1275 [Xylaria hypoxylon]
MPPTIDILCHAESRDSFEPNGEMLRDPSLTVGGEYEAERLGMSFPHMSQVKRIISSPMRRAIETATRTFKLLINQQDIKVVLVPELQECSSKPSDMGSPVPELRGEFGFALDLGLLSDGWWYKDVSARDQIKIAERARQARLYIRGVARQLGDDDHIVVVTHREFITHLIQSEPRFRNLEFRGYQFVDVFGGDDQAFLA